jgi:predicted O-methyltransferase YrrM
VSDPLEELKAELERFERTNDQTTRERSRRMLNITRDTGEFLAVLVRATEARTLLEIGTSNGYSTLWLGEAAKATGGKVTTVESSEYKVELAAAIFERSGLGSLISLVHDDAGRLIGRSEAGAFDFIFLDAERTQYVSWWPDLRRVLCSGGLLVVDNAVSHPQEMAPLTALLKTDALFTTSLVPVGNGELLAVKGSA